MPGFEDKEEWSEIKYRIEEPEKCTDRFGRQDIGGGITRIACISKNTGKWMTQALRFKKKEGWTLAKAKAWVEEHKDKFSELISDITEPNEKLDITECLFEKEMETKTLENVEIFRTGIWKGRLYTISDLEEIEGNFRKLHDKLKVPFKLGHGNEIANRSGMPAIGWFETLKRVGDKLIASIIDVPKKVFELVRAGAYKKISSEIFLDYWDKDSKTKLGKVFAGAALLGADLPEVDSLDDILALYSREPEVFTFSKEELAMKETFGAIGYEKYPLASEDTQWDAGAEVKTADIDDLRKMCAWYDAENPGAKISYKLPHHMKEGYKTVWNGVRAVMGALLGTRGGVDISVADKQGVYSHLKKHYDEFEKAAPEFEKEYTEQELEQITGGGETKMSEQEIAELKKKVTEAEKALQKAEEDKAAFTKQSEEAKAKIEALEKEKAEKEAELIKVREAKEAETLEAFVSQLVTEGKVLPKHKEGVKAIFKVLKSAGMVKFEQKDTPVEEIFTGMLKSMPNLVKFEEISKSIDKTKVDTDVNRLKSKTEEDLEVSEESITLSQKAEEYAKEHNVSFEDALIAVSEK